MFSMTRKQIPRAIVILAFALLLIMGWFLADDYGLPYDDPEFRNYGIENLNYVLSGDPANFEHRSKYHGPAFEIVLAAAERLLRPSDSRSIYVIRHRLIFTFSWIGVWCFYRLCQLRFGHWQISLLGSTFLVVSPRIFAHSFYNSRDLAFLSVGIIGIYTLIRYLERRSALWLSWHAMVCAFLIDIRVVGIFLPVFTGICIISAAALQANTPKILKKSGIALLQYGFLLLLFTILFSPMLWKHPVAHFTQAFAKMSHYPFPSGVFYAGKQLDSLELPWHYVPVWLAITTPLWYVASFFPGMALCLRAVAASPMHPFFTPQRRIDILCLSWFFLPLSAIILLQSSLYDDWRHLFFIYPAFVMMALHSIVFAYTFIRTRFRGRAYYAMFTIVSLGLFVGIFEPLDFMIRSHPYQYVYFNRLAGADLETAKQRFEFDYWGLSYTEALRYIAHNDPDPQVAVFVERFPWRFCDAMLPADEREKIVCTNDFFHSKYFVGNYRMNPNGYPCDEVYYAVTVENARLAVVHPTHSCRTQ